MRIEVNKVLEDNSYNVTLRILEFDVGNYVEAIHDFGETPINFGGKIYQKSDEDTTLAILADNKVKISEIADCAIVQYFSTSQYKDNAQLIADAWADLSVSKIEDYVKEMCAKIDTFTTKYIIDV